MENYILKPDEYLLYRCDCGLKSQNTGILKSLSPYTNAELLLTNQNLILTKKAKNVFSKTPAEVEVYPIVNIKIYNDIPQIKRDGTCVEIFFTNGEVNVEFFSKIEVRKFINKAFELLTGKTTAIRVSDKVKNAAGFIDDTIGINPIDTIKNVTENGLVGAAFGIRKKDIPSKATISKSLTGAVGIAKDLIGKDTKKPEIEDKNSESIDVQVDSLKKLKDLLDAGIITQEEFAVKKKQILGL